MIQVRWLVVHITFKDDGGSNKLRIYIGAITDTVALE